METTNLRYGVLKMTVQELQEYAAKVLKGVRKDLEGKLNEIAELQNEEHLLEHAAFQLAMLGEKEESLKKYYIVESLSYLKKHYWNMPRAVQSLVDDAETIFQELSRKPAENQKPLGLQ